MPRSLALFLATLSFGAMSVLLIGCSTDPPTKEDMEAANYGPKPDNYQQIVRDFLRNRLTDPTAAIIDFKAGPTQMYQKDTMIRDLQVGWAVCVMVNDKNSRGAYQGFVPAVYYIRNGKVVVHNGGPDDTLVGVQFARRQCKQLGYDAP
jgi:hypothetical protein